MALADAQTAYLTARAGAGRAGAMRAGYVPKDTRSADGTTQGPYVFYARVYPSSTSYTLVKS